MLRTCIETPDDRAEVEYLFDLAFAPGRTALSSYRLRDGVEPVAALCLVARDDDVLAGAIRYWPVRIGAAGRPGAPARPGGGAPDPAGRGARGRS